MFNRGSQPVDVAGWTVQYASATGSSWVRTPLGGIIQPGQYYLVQEGGETGGSVSLPTPDASGGINLSATTAKIALVSNSNLLSGTSPTGAQIVDFVGYGSANFAKGSPAPSLDNTTAAIRRAGGCTDTGNNSADFTVGSPSPHNSRSPINLCNPVPPPSPGTAPTVNDGGIVNNASYNLASLAVAPGAIIAIFGSNLTDGTSCLPPSSNPTFGSDGRLSTLMAGAQVTVNGTPVPIFYASPIQLGIQIPVEFTGTSASVQVAVRGQTSSPRTVFVEPVSPGIFSFTSDGRGPGAITHADGSPVTVGNPARPGEIVIIYATGLGQVTPSTPTGARPNGVSRTALPTTVMIDGLPVTPEFAGLSGCCVGLNQINVQIPANSRLANNIPVALSIGGRQSNTVTITVGTSGPFPLHQRTSCQFRRTLWRWSHGTPKWEAPPRRPLLNARRWSKQLYPYFLPALTS